MKNFIKKYSWIIALLLLLTLIAMTTTSLNKKRNDPSEEITDSIATTTQIAEVAQIKKCTIPDSLKMSDMIGLSMKELSDKYGATFTVYSSGYAANIMCENSNYKVNIMSTQKDHIANYIIMELKEFGTCTAGVENVEGWVDKSIKAVGYDPSVKGTPTYNTENNVSQIVFEKYNAVGKNLRLVVECNITGNYIGVNAILLKE